MGGPTDSVHGRNDSRIIGLDQVDIDCVKTQFSRDMKIDLRIFHLEKILVGGIMLGVNGKLKVRAVNV